MLLTRILLAAAHLLVGAVWFGAMAYSVAVVQPRAARFFGTPQRYEEFAQQVAAGARWRVVGLIATLAATGAVLALVADRPDQRTLWWSLLAVKALLLVAAAAVFWRVSWRMWPRRVFATGDELPAHHRAFSQAGWTLIGLVGAAAVVGVVAHQLPG